jgi:diadenosine tetraphosphatase ApaH/serine/threonine PP2A family protein phosphatase
MIAILADIHANLEKMADIFSRIERVCFVGHTHVPGVFTEQGQFLLSSCIENRFVTKKGKFLINVGSVGQSRDNDSRPCYVLFDGETVLWRRVPHPNGSVPPGHPPGSA